MTIRAGQLRHLITIQQRSTATDDYGGPVDDWISFAENVRASVEPLQGREFYASQQMQAEVTTRFRIRYISGVSPVMRISFEGRLFNITSVLDPDMRHQELHLMAVEVMA